MSERPQRPRTVILDLAKHADRLVHVKLAGGRQGERYPVVHMCRSVQSRLASIFLVRGANASLSVFFLVVRVLRSTVRGVLKGWDPLVNLVLDEAVEEMRGAFYLLLCAVMARHTTKIMTNSIACSVHI